MHLFRRMIATDPFKRNTPAYPEFKHLGPEFLVLASSTGIHRAVSLGLNLALARLLGPSTYGQWNAIMVFADYLAYLQLGVLNGMNLKVPFSLGQGNPGRADSIRHAASAGVLVAAGLGAGIFLAVPSSLVAPSGNWLAVRLAALYVIGLQLYSLMASHFRSIQRFDLFSCQQNALSIGLAVVALPLAVLGGLSGVVFGQAIAFGCPALFWLRSRAQLKTLRPAFDLREWLNLVRTGLPIMAVGLGYLCLTNLDRFVVLYIGGLDKLGHYAFQLRILSLSALLAGLVADQVYPRVAEVYGRTHSPQALVSFLRLQMAATLALTLGANLALYVGVPLLVNRWFLPYQQSLGLMPTILLGMSLLPLCSVFGVVLNVLGWQAPYLAAQAAIIPLGVFLSVRLTRSPMGILGTARATAITYALYFACLAALTAIAMRGASWIAVPRPSLASGHSVENTTCRRQVLES